MGARYLFRKAVIRLTGIMGLIIGKEGEKGRLNSFGGNKQTKLGLIFLNLNKMYKFRQEIRQCNLVLFGGRGYVF